MLVNFKSSDVDFDKQRLRVHHMLIVKNKKEWSAKKMAGSLKKDWTRTRERFYLFIRWLTYA